MCGIAIRKEPDSALQEIPGKSGERKMAITYSQSTLLNALVNIGAHTLNKTHSDVRTSVAWGRDRVPPQNVDMPLTEHIGERS